MWHLVRRLWHQVGYASLGDHGVGRLAKLRLGLKFDCYVSPRALVYRPHQIRLERGVRIEEGVMLNFRAGAKGTLTIGARTKVMPGARLVPLDGRIVIGQDCSINYSCLLYGRGGLEVGDNTRIAAFTVITPMNHIFEDPGVPIWRQGETALGVKIGSDVWIGNGVRILDGVEIGDGAVVGAGAVVTKNVPAFSIAVGVPARVVGRRSPQVATAAEARAGSTAP